MLGRFNAERIRVVLEQTRGEGGEQRIRSNRGSCARESLWDKLREKYWERRISVDGAKRWKGGRNLLEPLVASGEFRVSFTINLLPDAQGYTITPAAKNGSDPESISIPYQDQEVLEYLDNQQIPPMLLDILQECQSCFLYCGCLIAEIRDFRCYHMNTSACDRHLLLLRPTNQTLAMAVDKLAQENNLSQEEKLRLESKLLVSTERPLCLDPSPDVLAVTSHIYSQRDLFNSKIMRRAIKRQSPAAASRQASKSLEPTPPEFALHDFISNSQLLKNSDPTARWLKTKISADPWRRHPLQLSMPSSIDVSRLAKPFEWDGREKVFAPELLQRIEIKLDSMGGTEGADCCRLTVYRRPSDGQYSVVVSFGQDGEYSEKQSPPHQLGQRAGAQRYLDHFLESYARTAPLISVVNHVEGQPTANKSSKDLSPFVKSSNAELALEIPNSNNSFLLQTEAQFHQTTGSTISSVSPPVRTLQGFPFVSPDSFIPTSQPAGTPRSQSGPARVTRRQSVPTPVTRKASATSKELSPLRSPSSSVSSPTQSPAGQKPSAPQTRSGAVRRGNPASLRNRRTSFPSSSSKVQPSLTRGRTHPYAVASTMASAVDTGQGAMSSNSSLVFATSNRTVSGTVVAAPLDVQSPISASSYPVLSSTSASRVGMATTSDISIGSTAQSLAPTKVSPRSPSLSQVSASSGQMNPVWQGASHKVMSTMGMQTVGRLAGGQLATVVLPTRSMNAGIASLSQAQMRSVPQAKGACPDNSKARPIATTPCVAYTTPLSVLTTSSAKGHLRSTVLPSWIASSKQGLHQAGASLQLQPKSSTATCTVHQLCRSSVAVGTSMTLTQQGGQLQLVPSQHGQSTVISAKQLTAQQRTLGQPILVRTPTSYHPQGSFPVQTIQLVPQQLNVSRPKGGSKSVATGVTSAQRQTPTAVTHPAVRFVLTPRQAVPRMVSGVSGKQVVLQFQPTVGRLTQPAGTLQQQQTRHVAPHSLQSMAVSAPGLVVPIQIAAPSSSTAPAASSTGKTS